MFLGDYCSSSTPPSTSRVDIAMEMSPSKMQRSTEGAAEEDFTAFVESALSPLATGTYSQSADNSRDAPLLPSSQRSDASQQQIPHPLTTSLFIIAQLSVENGLVSVFLQ